MDTVAVDAIERLEVGVGHDAELVGQRLDNGIHHELHDAGPQCAGINAGDSQS